MAKLDWLVVALLFAAPPAAADIFKCVQKNGIDRYQNFPCAVDSIGSSSSGPVPPGVASPPAGARQTPAGRPNKASEPRVGMTKGEITAIWGEPEEIIQDEPRHGRIEIWRYGDGRSVQFSNKHRVLVVDR